MKSTRLQTLTYLLTLLALWAAGRAAAGPLGTGFTYQGRLDDGAFPVNGYYDFNFMLYDADTGGAPVGPIAGVSTNRVAVSNGVFSVYLDFGAVFTGDKRWLEMAVETNGVSPLALLTPRQPLHSAPYALYALKAAMADTATTAATATTATTAATAGVANSVAANAVNNAGLQSASVTASKIANATVVRSVNGLTDALTLAAGANITLTPAGNTLTISGSGSGAPPWLLGGNAGTDPDVNFLGTTDNEALTIRVNNSPAIRIVPTFGPGEAPNIIAGSSANNISSANFGSIIAGGGSALSPNIMEGADHSFIGGGLGNYLLGDFSTISGGQTNVASGLHSAVAGGRGNNASGQAASMGGGQLNSVTGPNGTIAGGIVNTNSAPYASIGGGFGNRAAGQDSVVAGGSGNAATAGQSTVGGGIGNRAAGNQSIVSGGAANSAGALSSTVAGGQNNTNSTIYGTIGGGALNVVSGPYSGTVAGGYLNKVSGQDSTVSGGSYNTAQGSYSAIAGGQQNYVGTNIVDLIEFGFITNSANYSGIAAGYNNKVSSHYSAVGGGLDNKSFGDYGVVGGGSGNTLGNPGLPSASSSFSTVGGGRDNVAANSYAVVPGGRSAVASRYGQFAFAAGHLDRVGDAQSSMYVLRRKFNGNGDLYLDDAGAVPGLSVPPGAVWTLRFQISAVSVTGANFGSYEVSGVIANVGGIKTFRLMDGSGAVVGTARPLFETVGAADWLATPNLNADGTLHVTVFAGELVKWCARIDVTEVTR